ILPPGNNLPEIQLSHWRSGPLPERDPATRRSKSIMKKSGVTLTPQHSVTALLSQVYEPATLDVPEPLNLDPSKIERYHSRNPGSNRRPSKGFRRLQPGEPQLLPNRGGINYRFPNRGRCIMHPGSQYAQFDSRQIPRDGHCRLATARLSQEAA